MYILGGGGAGAGMGKGGAAGMRLWFWMQPEPKFSPLCMLGLRDLEFGPLSLKSNSVYY